MATFLVVLRRSGPRWDPSRPLEEQSDWPAHASFMDALVDAGFVILGGPLADDERVVHAVEAESEDAVRATLARDPWSQTHLRIEAIEPWTIRLDARHTADMDVRSDGESPTTAERAGTHWRLHGVRVVRAGELDVNTPQTPGMNRAAAITTARAGAEKLWAGTVMIHPDAKTGAHHHGPLESVIYVVSGRARMRWGERLEFTAEAGPGDFIYVPPFVPHQEINASPDAPLSCVVVRSGQEPVVVNLDLPEVEPNPEHVDWVDDIHPEP